MRLVVVCLVAIATLLLAGCGERPGSPSVYTRIDNMTDCSALQYEFNIAADNTDRIQDSGGDAEIPMSYMDAADARMRELGCYG